MGPQARQISHRFSMVQDLDLKEKMSSGSGSPGRLQENISRDSGIGCLKDGGLNTSGETDHDIPKFITDNNDKTSYVRGKFLGKGGFARVHELIDLKTNSVSAGKIIHKSRISKPHHKEKISREIELHRSLRHKNVVQFFKHFEDGDNIYIMLENCSRKSLVHVLKCRVTVTEPETRYYMSALCSGVDYIHSQNIIHRDLKLGNLFLTHNMAVKIGDFGLATRLGHEKKGTICGTPNYISPEVLNKEGHGFPADVWALGCVMYALLVGQPPFETSTLKETYSRIADNIYTIPDSVSPSAAALIRQLLHPQPHQRPSVPSINQDSFFYSGYHPLNLSASCCTDPPIFPANHGAMFSHTDLTSLTSSVLSLSLPDSANNGHYRSTSNLDNVSCSSKPKQRTRTSALYDAILNTLHMMSTKQDPLLTPCKEGPLFITKWIDYSNKYGFGFQLSDKSVGVLFNDHSRISYSADRRFVQFGEGNNLTSMSSNQVPASLHEKFTLLRYFAQYMDENLTEGGEGGRSQGGGLKPLQRNSNPNVAIPQIKRWIRAPKAIIMHLTNGTIQVNYFKDHTKLIVGGDRQPMVTYINSERQSRTWLLSDLGRRGCSASVRERMSYVASVLEEFAELDEQASQ